MRDAEKISTIACLLSEHLEKLLRIRADQIYSNDFVRAHRKSFELPNVRVRMQAKIKSRTKSNSVKRKLLRRQTHRLSNSTSICNRIYSRYLFLERVSIQEYLIDSH